MIAKKQKEIIRKYLAGTASPEEIQWVDIWYEAFENQKVESQTDYTQMAAKSKQLILNRALQRDQLHFIQPLYKYAAVFAAILFITLLTLKFGNHDSADQLVTINTEGKRDTTFTTPDQSTIWLKENSKLSYVANKFGKGDRTVQLHKGEAYFEVRKNPSSPFLVKHHQAAIQVHGTGFNVFTDERKGKFDVMVSHGLVEVSHLNKRLSYLGKGEAISLNTSTGKFDTTHVNARYAAAWRNEEILLKQVSFKELSDVFYILYRMKLKSAHQATERYTYTLVINKMDDYLSTLMIITSMHQNKFKVQNDTVLIY